MEYNEEEQRSSMDSFLDAVQRQNLAQSRAHFDNLMANKIGDALESEKVAVASAVYGSQEEEELEQELDSLEAEVEEMEGEVDYDEHGDDIEKVIDDEEEL
jgi:hypothetical protein